MRYLKSYNKFYDSYDVDLSTHSIDLKESLNIWHDVLLNSISAEKLDMFDTLKLPKEKYFNKLDLDYLSDNIEFINSLSSLALKKSQIENTDDYETFVNNPCRFMFIYGNETNELENPLYIIFQTWTDSLGKWSDANLYKVNDDVKRFYDKLTSRTIEIVDGDENYIYQTSNGNEWLLQNSKKENDIYKKILRRDDLEKLINERGVTVSIR